MRTLFGWSARERKCGSQFPRRIYVCGTTFFVHKSYHYTNKDITIVVVRAVAGVRLQMRCYLVHHYSITYCRVTTSRVGYMIWFSETVVVLHTGTSMHMLTRTARLGNELVPSVIFAHICSCLVHKPLPFM